MSATIKTGLAAILLLAVISCTKENIKTSSIATRSTDKSVAAHYIGERYGGGIIFYIDSTRQHGLIADTVNFPPATWKNRTYTVTGATAKRIGKGQANTKKIILSQGTSGSYAALECANSTRSGKTDWFLPSKDELDSMYVHKKEIGGFAKHNYWSSSEANNYKAWYQNFYNGFRGRQNKGDGTDYVRAVRAF